MGKRRRTDGGDEDELSFERRKRIKWVEKDSTGASIDPQFSEDEGESSEAANSGGLDSSEDVDAYPRGYVGHPVSEIADDSPGESDGGGAIENLEMSDRGNALGAEGPVSIEQLERHHSEEASQAQPQFTLLRSPPKANGHFKAIQSGDSGEVHSMKEVLNISSESQGDVEVIEASHDEDYESDDRNKLMRAIRVNQILRDNQTEQTAVKEPVSSDMLKKAREYVHSNQKEDGILGKRARRDSNENMKLGSSKSEPLRIHMKANGDDSELDSDLSQDGSAPKVISFTGGFGFFVN